MKRHKGQAGNLSVQKRPTGIVCSYARGIDKGTAIYIKNVSLFDVPLPIANISPSIKVPQSYRYIREAEFMCATIFIETS